MTPRITGVTMGVPARPQRRPSMAGLPTACGVIGKGNMAKRVAHWKLGQGSTVGCSTRRREYGCGDGNVRDSTEKFREWRWLMAV